MNLDATVAGRTLGATFTAPGDLVGTVTALEGQTDAVHTQPHSGLDVAFPAGSRIPCLAPGTVIFTSRAGTAGWAEVFGNSCIVDHGDGTRALYAHFETLAVIHGEVLSVGDVLGVQGSTGESTGDHLHLGLSTTANPWFNKDADGGVSRLLDPLDHLGGAAVPVVPPGAPAPQPDARAVAALQAGYLAESNDRLRRMIEAAVPKFVIGAEVATAHRLLAQLEVSIDALP